MEPWQRLLGDRYQMARQVQLTLLYREGFSDELFIKSCTPLVLLTLGTNLKLVNKMTKNITLIFYQNSLIKRSPWFNILKAVVL